MRWIACLTFFPLILHCVDTSSVFLCFLLIFLSSSFFLSVASKSNQACKCLPQYLYLFSHTLFAIIFCTAQLDAEWSVPLHPNWPSSTDIQVHSVRFYLWSSEPVNCRHINVNNQDTINTMTYSETVKHARVITDQYCKTFALVHLETIFNIFTNILMHFKNSSDIVR